MRRRIGIFGGTFNPIHVGHIKMAEAAKKEYRLSRVYFIPCGIPPHKPKDKLLSAKLRYKLVKEAIKGKKYFKVLDIEINKRKPCYTIDTIRRLADLPVRRDMFFLIGADEFEKLHSWKKPNELAKLVTFLVLPRRKRKIKEPRVKNLRWLPVHTKLVNISSTRIRKELNLSF